MERWLRLRETRGLTLREIAARSGIPPGTLSWWAHHLRRVEAGSDFVEVRVAGQAAEGSSPRSVAVESVAAARVRLPSGITVTLRGGAAQRLTESLLASVSRW